MALVLGLCGPRFARAEVLAGSSPNVLLIMTDDQGWGDLSAHGNTALNTPHLDALAASGASLQRFFVSPVCAPTRAGLLTGRYPLRTGTHGVTRGRENMRGEETTMAELFQQAGYRTGCFGKWHNGAHWPAHPNGQGFDEFIGFCAGHWNNYFSTRLEHNGSPIATNGYIANVLTDRAIEFMKRDGSQPFFCYVPLNTPHSPWQVPESYWRRHLDSPLDEKARCAYAMCENIDDNVGRMLDCLDDLGIANHTLVIFLTDNGPNSDRFNGDMRGRKASVHEGGSRVPCFLRFPNRIPAGVSVEQITANIDLLPTLCELCGIKLPNDLELDGHSLTPLVTSADPRTVPWPDRSLIVCRGKGERGAVRTQRWRAVLSQPGKWLLFDMQADPGESRDVARANPERLNRLRLEYEAFLAQVNAEDLEPLPIELGHPQRATVTLPGHEAFLDPLTGGGISYVGESGWANDWITAWTNPQASAYWTVNVVKGGTFEVSIEYALASIAPPPRLQLEARDASLVASISEIHEARILASPDRIKRGEVYEREWRLLRLGEIRLAAGPQKLTLIVPNADQNASLEVKSLQLTLLPPRN